MTEGTTAVKTLTVLATDEQTVQLGPELGTLEPDEIPTTMFLPLVEWVALGEPQRVAVTIEAAEDES